MRSDPRTYSELPSYEVIIPAMLEHGIFNLRENCKLQAGVPLKPMLAKPTKSITEVLDRFEGKHFTCEFKYDGERAQIHYVSHDSPNQLANIVSSTGKGQKGLSSIFSRNSEDLSKKYPDILAKLETWVKPATKSFVLDCETVAWDMVEKKLLPFQQLMTRKRKDVKVEDVKVKVCVFAFDILYLNGEVSYLLTFGDHFLICYSQLSRSRYANEENYSRLLLKKSKASLLSLNTETLVSLMRFRPFWTRASKHLAKVSW